VNRLGGDPAGAALQDRLARARGGLPRFVEIAGSLVMEKLPILPLSPLVERYLELAGQPTADVAEEVRLVAAVRAALIRDVETWKVYTLDDGFEDALRDGVRREGDAAVLALEPKPTQSMLAAVREAVVPADRHRAVLIVEDWRLRPFVKSLIILEFPEIRVVARREVEGVSGVPVPSATIGVVP
jgi:type III secretory pathway component EscV